MITELDAHVFESPIADGGNDSDGWAKCLERFTDRNAHRRVVVEEDGADLGVARSVVNAPLAGISYDRRDQTVQIMLDGDTARGAHRTVVVRNISAVDTLSAPNGRDVALRLANPNGQVLLTFLPVEL